MCEKEGIPSAPHETQLADWLSVAEVHARTVRFAPGRMDVEGK